MVRTLRTNDTQPYKNKVIIWRIGKSFTDVFGVIMEYRIVVVSVVPRFIYFGSLEF